VRSSVHTLSQDFERIFSLISVLGCTTQAGGTHDSADTADSWTVGGDPNPNPYPNPNPNPNPNPTLTQAAEAAEAAEAEAPWQRARLAAEARGGAQCRAGSMQLPRTWGGEEHSGDDASGTVVVHSDGTGRSREKEA
jgi:hypothetical protein